MPIHEALPQTAFRTVSKGQLWTGRILAVICVLFLLFDGVGKLMRPHQVLEGTAQLGFAPSTLPVMGVALLLFTVLFVIPRTAVLGAAFLTAYLGGAVAAQVRIGAPLFNDAFAVIFAILIWASLWLRYPRVRGVFPLLAPTASEQPTHAN